MEKEILVRLMSELGFPILVTIVSIYLFFLTLKYILNEVKVLLGKTVEVIHQVDRKIKHAELLIVELDILTSTSLGFKADIKDLVSLTNKEILRKQKDYYDH